MRLFEYFFWKRMARKAIAEKKTATCCSCEDPIVPGDFIAICQVKEGEKYVPALVHAGFHFTLTDESAFCETGAVGNAFWDGEKAVRLGESGMSEALRTDSAVIRNY